MSSEQRLFGRYHDIAILLIGFVFTTLVGGYLSYAWQNRADEYERVAEDRRLELVAATHLFDELSRLMDRRLFRMRRLHTGLADRNRDPKTLEPRWEAYQEALFDWNENLNRNLALTQRYFGTAARDVLEREINEGFRKLGALLEGNGYPEEITSQYDYRQRSADQLNSIIYDFDLRLIEAIQSGAVGKFRHGP